jgi:hypothetical protein
MICGILCNNLIGPCIFGRCLTALYCRKCHDGEVVCSDDVPLAIQRQMWLHDREPLLRQSIIRILEEKL